MVLAGSTPERRVECCPGPSRHHRSLARADRSLAGRHLRPGPREEPSDLALPGLPARVEGGQRLRPAPRGPDGLRRHGAGRGARGRRPRRRASSPPKSGSYYPEDNGPLRTDLKPLEITQPEGPSFEVEGNLVRWQKWTMRVGMDPFEGLVLWRVGYEDGGHVRPVLYRAAVSEMVVPYGHPSPMHAWKSAFDAGEWGLGRMANSLTLGCDCLGEIHYFDDVWADERGRVHTRKNAICMHEEDYGILWKHADLVSGRTEVRRSRRLVVSSIATVGNYEYGFYWYFDLDGSMQLEVKLSGIMSTMAVANGDPGPHARMIAPGSGRPLPPAPVQRPPRRRGGRAGQRRLRSGCRGRRRTGHRGEPVGQRVRHHDDVARDGAGRAARRGSVTQPELAHRQPARRERAREPTAYKLLPTSTPTILAHPESSVSKRATFATHNLWVTPFEEDERRAAGDYPNQHAGGDRLAGVDGTRPEPGRHRRRAGTPSVSPTYPVRRTGRSCRSSTPASH